MLSVGVVMSGLRSLLSAAVIAALIVPATPRAALALDGPTSRATWTITHQAGSPATGSRLAVGDTIRVGFTSSSDGLLPISCSFGVLLRAPGGGYAAMDFTVPATASGCSFEMVVPLPQGRWYQPDPTLYSFDVSAHASYADEIARPLLPTLAGGPSCATDLLCFVLVGGGARRTFTSTPELLSWNPFDWDPAYTRFAFGSPWSLRFPAWVSDCGGIELNGSWTTTMRIGSPDSCQEGITMTIPGIIPAGFPWDPVEDWELTASLRYARAGDGLWGGVSWMEATPIAPSDAPFASTAQAIFPIEIGVARFVTLGDRWAPSFHVSGFGPSIPEGTTCALEVVTIGWSFPGWPADDDRGYHVQSPVDSSGDCIFSIATPYTTVGQENQWNVSLIVPGESSSPEVFAATLTAAAPPVLPVIADPVAGATSDGVTGITLTTVPGSDAGLGIGSEVSPDPAPAAAPAVLSEPAGLAAYGTTCAASSISPKLALGSGGSLSTLTARCGLADGTYTASSTKVDVTGKRRVAWARFTVRGGSITVIARWSSPARPFVVGLAVRPRAGTALAGSSIPLALTWSGWDIGGPGIRWYELSRQVDGGSWTADGTSATTVAYRTVASSGTVRYRVRGRDVNGLPGAWVSIPTLGPRLVQQSATSILYRGGWRGVWSSAYSGGSARYATTAGASATVTFTGRSIAFVTTTGPSRGVLKVYRGTTLVATVDLWRPTTSFRVLAWQKTWATSATRTLRFVVAGTSGRPRVDLDAIAVLR